METRQQAHPGPRHLAALALGQLKPEARQRIQSHVSNCPACAEFLSKTPRDALLAMLRQGASRSGADQPTPGGQAELRTVAEIARVPAPLPQSLMPSSPARRSATAPAAAGLAPESLPPELRQQSKYRIVRLLGRGGMGSVYEAHHERMDRRVAIKVINPDLVDDPQALLRFEEEIKAVAKLDHPNIARAYDAESFGALQAIIMEFIPGQTLHEFFKARGGRLSVIAACRCVRQSLLGLQHAHDRGLVHRDLKPQNLMLARDTGLVKILDFGLAKMRENRQSRGLTNSNMTMGTYEYMAPEQALDAAAADARADIYSLGCTLYYLLAGVLPFAHDTDVKLLLAHQYDIPRALVEVRSDVPPEVSDLVARMLAKNPADRPQTPDELAQLLLPFAKGEAPAPAIIRAAATPVAEPGPADLFDEVAHGAPPVRGPRPRTSVIRTLASAASRHWIPGSILSAALLGSVLFVLARRAILATKNWKDNSGNPRLVAVQPIDPRPQKPDTKQAPLSGSVSPIAPEPRRSAAGAVFANGDAGDWQCYPDPSKPVELKDGLIVLDKPGSVFITRNTDYRNVNFTLELAADQGTEAFMGVRLLAMDNSWIGMTSRILDEGTHISAGMQWTNFEPNSEHGMGRATISYGQFFSLSMAINGLTMWVRVNGEAKSGVAYGGRFHTDLGALGIRLVKGRIKIKRVVVSRLN